MLAVEFARFLGPPLIARANITDVIEAVCGVEVSDTLKYFSGRIPATFGPGEAASHRDLRERTQMIAADAVTGIIPGAAGTMSP